MKKFTLITGATSGIGYEMAKILAKKGNNLLLVSRNKEKLQNIQTEFTKGFKIELDYIVMDLSKANAAKNVFDKVQVKNYFIEILINNSGFATYGEHVDIDLTENQKLLQLNIVALTEMCALFGAKMKEKKSGKILNIASTAAYQPTPYISAYGASKAYVLNFSEALAKELEDYQVSVTCLSPGPTESNFFKAAKMDKNELEFMNKKMSSEKVAQIVIKAMYDKKLSKISGFKNWFLTFSNRFAPRSMVAYISKRIMQKN
jgi:short-subunit dehydrogenase